MLTYTVSTSWSSRLNMPMSAATPSSMSLSAKSQAASRS